MYLGKTALLSIPVRSWSNILKNLFVSFVNLFIIELSIIPILAFLSILANCMGILGDWFGTGDTEDMPASDNDPYRMSPEEESNWNEIQNFSSNLVFGILLFTMITYWVNLSLFSDS